MSSSFILNRAWSIFSKGKPYSDPRYSRKVDPGAFSLDNEKGLKMLDLVCPFSDDVLRAHRADKIIDLILGSSLSERLLELDPVNTYKKSTLSYPEPGVSIAITSQPTPLSIFSFIEEDNFISEGSGTALLSCTVDGASKVISSYYSTKSFTMTSGLSSYVTIYPGIRIRMKSDFLSVSPYLFDISYTVYPKIDFKEILKAASAFPAEWSDRELEKIWEEDTIWSNRLAAFFLSAMELCSYGNKP